jgi:hypothetical protein
VSLERLRRHGEALAVSERALALCRGLDRGRLAAMRGAPRGGWTADWERRCGRLRARVAAQSPPPAPALGGGVVAPAPLFAN